MIYSTVVIWHWKYLFHEPKESYQILQINFSLEISLRIDNNFSVTATSLTVTEDLLIKNM